MSDPHMEPGDARSFTLEGVTLRKSYILDWDDAVGNRGQMHFTAVDITGIGLHPFINGKHSIGSTTVWRLLGQRKRILFILQWLRSVLLAHSNEIERRLSPEMKKSLQIVMHCPCGNLKILAKGLCSTCYTLKRQDEEYFGGHREEVLKRDDYRCCVPGCVTVKRGKRSVAVHHREPGNNDPGKMLTLCLACHAKVTRTFYVQDDWPEFLRVLWREQHPEGHEQHALNFAAKLPPAKNVPLFADALPPPRRRYSRNA